MISFSCPRCGKKLSVKADLAGRSAKCSACRSPVQIPSSTEDADGEDLTIVARLKVAGEIARGGMGAIMRATDAGIQREVAVKFLLNQADSQQKARFVEEAQITGQLEHPNIVPVHQLGAHDDGRCFFSMKMVKGRSLAQILKEDRPDDTLARLLGVFVGVCNAMAYAHSRQVIHRDLKPANIMVGDFGEVYVMDWGLAKVLGKPEPPIITMPPGTSSSPSIASSSDTRVTTQRAGELTQAGAILGTPAYMPPEQASGADVDERSDIYSLGAILYEILTRTPPVGRGGDLVTILMRVAEGQIDPPAARAPDRAKDGRIPPELSAIAMKALAHDPAKRYASVPALKRDIELYQEGRSVSAKHDSAWEIFTKLVRRNRGVSIATAAALVTLAAVLGVAFKVNRDARIVAETTLEKLETSEKERKELGRESVSAFVKAARQAISDNRIEDAQKLLNVAGEFDKANAEAYLVRAQISLFNLDLVAARADLAECLRLDPKRQDAKSLAALAAAAHLDEAKGLHDLANELGRQQAYVVAGKLTERATEMTAATDKMMGPYRARINAAWPGVASSLAFVDNQLDFRLTSQTIRDLKPLMGMPIKKLTLTGCPVTDLAPLKGMKLTSLTLSGCREIRDLEPLRGMKLTSLNVAGCPQIKDWSFLEGMPIEELDLSHCAQVSDLRPFQNLPLVKLHISGTAITDLELMRGKKLTELGLGDVSNLAPLSGMPLERLSVQSSALVDLSPLRKMPLKVVNFIGCSNLRDLSPLRGAPLESINLQSTAVADLSPLEESPIKTLLLYACPVTNLRPLSRMPLSKLILSNNRKVADLTPLAGLPLLDLEMSGCTEVEDLGPLRKTPLARLSMTYCSKVVDVTPLEGMKLSEIALTSKYVTKGMDVLRAMQNLTWIHDEGISSRLPASEYWKRYDAGEFKK